MLKYLLVVYILLAGLVSKADSVPYFDLQGTYTNTIGRIPCGWELTIVTTNANGMFSVTPTSATNLMIYWGDSMVSNYTGSARVDHYYATAGTYQMELCGRVSCLAFGHNDDTRAALRRVNEPVWGLTGLDSFYNTFDDCVSIEYIPVDLFKNLGTNINSLRACFSGKSPTLRRNLVTTYPAVNHLTGVTDFRNCWEYTSAEYYPDVYNLTNAFSISAAWQGCVVAKSMPNIAPLVKNSTALSIWHQCSKATNFPSIAGHTNNTSLFYTWATCYQNPMFDDISKHTQVGQAQYTWNGNTNISGNIPDFSALTNITVFNAVFSGLRNITGDVSMFSVHTNILYWHADNCSMTYTNRGDWVYWPRNGLANNATFSMPSDALDQASVSQILIDLDFSGSTNGVSNMDGTGTYSNANPNALGMAAVTNLRAKGWTITINE